MTISELTKEALKKPVKSLPGEMVLGGHEDKRPAIESIISALIREAAKGSVTAAKELREYMALEREI